jgi:F-type H+-transporting ATPase subunit epsilon
MAHLQCVVVTPEATVRDEPADFVALPLYDGEIGILPGRAPLIGRLGYGEMRLVSGGQTAVYYVDGGFVQVNDNVVSVLTGRAVPASELKAGPLREQLEETLRRQAHAPELMELRDRQVAQARAMLRVAESVGK